MCVEKKTAQQRRGLWLQAALVSLIYLAPSAALCFACGVPIRSLSGPALFFAVVVMPFAFVDPLVTLRRYKVTAADADSPSNRKLMNAVERLAHKAGMGHVPRLFISPTKIGDARIAGYSRRHSILVMDARYLNPYKPESDTDSTIAHELGHILTDSLIILLVFEVVRGIFITQTFFWVASLLPSVYIQLILAPFTAVVVAVCWWVTGFGERYLSRCAESAADVVSVVLSEGAALADSLLRNYLFDEDGKPHPALGDRDFRTIRILSPYDEMPGLWGKIRRFWYRINDNYPPLDERIRAIRKCALVRQSGGTSGG